MTVPRADYTNAGGVVLRFPYNARLVELLKTEIPPHARSYDPAAKAWIITASYAAITVDLLRRHFPDTRIEQPGTRRKPEPLGFSQPFAALHLLPSAPPELIEGAYRILARIHPPDAGGTDKAMRALNEARDLLRERLPA